MLYNICWANPFTHAVELIRFAFYGQINWPSLAYVAVATAVFLGLAIYGYDPGRGLISRKAGA
jgi:ABC-2 type transport system permease protein